MRGGLVTACLCALFGCADAPTLRVDLRTDLVPGVEVDRVVVVFDSDTQEHEVTNERDYLGGVRVAFFEGLPSGSRSGAITAFFGATEVVTRPIVVSLAGDTGVTVVLTRDCRGVACPGAGDVTQAACLGGRCVNERCTEETLAECREPECAGDSECVADAACAVGRCLAGTCLFAEGSGCAGDEYCDAERGCLARPTSGEVTVSDLGVAWTTSNVVRWTWQMEGVEADFRGLRIELGDDAANVGMRVVDGNENPELASFRITESDRTLATTTFGHDPDMAVFARLVVTDALGRTSATEIVQARTMPAPADRIVIFADAETPGYSIPGSFVRSDADPFMGTHAYEAAHECPDMQAACWEIYRRQEVGVDLSAIPMERVSSAYLEWSAQIDSNSLYSSVRIFLGPSGARRLYAREGFALRGNGEYRTYQWPLRELIDMGEGIDHAALQDGLYEFGIGGFFPVGTTIRWDEVSIRY